jgi:hypothetical protein
MSGWCRTQTDRRLSGLAKVGVQAFPRSEVNDIHESMIGNFFVNGSGVYVLVTGLENARIEQFDVTDEGTGKTRKVSRKTGNTRHYIARFKNDGSYDGAIKLDLPFQLRCSLH